MSVGASGQKSVGVETSNVGFEIEWEALLFPEEVYALKDVYGLSDVQMLSLSSTGTFVAAVSPKAKDKVETVLRQNGVEVRLLGSFTKDLHRVLIKNGEELLFPEEANDPYASFFSKNS